MEMRDRLIELIADSRQLNAWNVEDKWGRIQDLADYLLANGVIVPPCKVGDTVYFLLEDDVPVHKWFLSEEKVTEIASKGFFTSSFTVPCGDEDFGNYTAYTEIGTDVFLTQEEAEKALAERGT